LAQPSGGGGQGGGKHVALAYKNLSLEEYRKLVANQRPKGRGLPKESFASKPGVPGVQHAATSVCAANQFDAIAPLAEMDDYSWEYEESPTTHMTAYPVEGKAQ
jgi:hypothetical protein